MRLFFLCLGLASLVVAGCGSNSHSPAASNQILPTLDPAKIDPADDELAARQFQLLQNNFLRDYRTLKDEIVAASTESKKQQVFAQYDPLPKYIDDLLALSRVFSQTKTAVDATLEAVSRSKGQQKDRNMRYLIETFPTKLRYDKITQSLANEAPSAVIEAWLKLLIENAPEGKDRAFAILGFTTYIKNLPEFQKAFAKNPQLLAKLPESQRQYLNTPRTEAQQKEVCVLLNEVIENHKGINYRMGRTFDEAARMDLFEMTTLAVGQPAPDIIGKDLDGIEFKLSDYSGKIIMLDFWGHWCGPCRKMYPEERELVRKLAGAPFVLIGMNSDHNLEFARDAVESEGLSWRHFWNGPDGTRGPIASAWNIDAWPTVFLIDGNGIIRYKDVLGDDLSNALENLLAESGHNIDLSNLN